MAIERKSFLRVDELPQNINIENSVDFYVNDFATDGYGIYKKAF
ncbi:hypothetical protein [Tamlana sp. I1]|nr:hypothetical protein [Tamlana sp. I1]